MVERVKETMSERKGGMRRTRPVKQGARERRARKSSSFFYPSLRSFLLVEGVERSDGGREGTRARAGRRRERDDTCVE